MTERDEVNFGRLMTDVFGTYGRKINEGMTELYFNTLAGYAFEDVAEAMYRHLADPDKGQYHPKPADVVRNIQGGGGSRALNAWDTAVRAITEVGSYRTVAFEDRLIGAVIQRMGGWQHFCSMHDDYTEEENSHIRFVKGDKDFRRKEFTERYTAYLQTPPDDIPASLPGFLELTNGRTEYAEDPRAIEAKRPSLVGPRPKLRPAPVPMPQLSLAAKTQGDQPKASIGGMASLGQSLLHSAETVKIEPTEEQREATQQRRRDQQDEAARRGLLEIEAVAK